MAVKPNSGRPARTKAPKAAPTQVKTSTTTSEAPIEETSFEETWEPGTALARFVANPGEPPKVQRSAEMLQKMPSSHTRQEIMRTLQQRYGNSYTSQVISRLTEIQRSPAVNAIQRNWWDDFTNYISTHKAGGTPNKDKQTVFGPAVTTAYSKPTPIGATPMANIQNNLATPGINSGNLEAKAGSGQQYSAPVEGFKGNSIIIGNRTTANGEWQQNSTNPTTKATLEESGNGTRTIWKGDQTTNTSDTKFTRSLTNGTYTSASNADTDLLGVQTNTKRNDTFTGTQSQYSGTTPGSQPGQTFGNQYTNTNGKWGYTEDKTATYTDKSLENKRDQRTNETTKTTSSGDGTRYQATTSAETKTTDSNPLNNTTSTSTNTSKDTRDRIDGSWNTREDKTTNFGPGNKDFKTSESTVKGSSGNGVRDIFESSTEDKYEQNDPTNKSTYTRSSKTTNKSSLTEGDWSDVDNKETKYSNGRYERTESTKNATGTRQQTENTTENKRTYTQEGEVPSIFSDKEVNKTSNHKGTWDETTVKETRNGNWSEESTSKKWGNGTRDEKGTERSSDYVDSKGRERTNSETITEKTTKGTEYSTSVTTTKDNTGYTKSAKANVFTTNGVPGGTSYSKDYTKVIGKPKDESAPPPKPKTQEAVLWTYSDASDSRKDLAKSQGTYSSQGNKDTDPHFSESYSYQGGYTGTSSKATVTTGSATYQGSATAGYSVIGGQYNRTDKGSIGAVNLKNDFKAGGMVGAEATAGGGATISWNGDPSITARGNASVFVGAKGNVSNTTVASLGKGAATVNLAAEGMAGASADAKGELGISTKGLLAQGQASAFAGAKVTASGEATLGYGGHNFLTAKGTLEGSAGIGGTAKGSFGIDWTTGTITIGAGLAATVGLGAGASGEVSINLVEGGLALAEGAYDAVEAVSKTPLGKQVVQGLKDVYQGARQKGIELYQYLQTVPGKLNDLGKKAVEGWHNFTNNVSTTLTGWGNSLKAGYNNFMSGVDSVKNSISQKLNGLGQSIKQYSGPVLAALTDPIGTAKNVLGSLAQASGISIPNIVQGFNSAKTAGINFLKGKWQGLQQTGKALLGNLQSWGSSIKQGFGSALSSLSSGASSVVSGIGNFVKGAGATASSLWNSFTQFGSNIKSGAMAKISSIGQSLQGITQSVGNLGGMLAGKLQGVLSGGAGLRNFASSASASIGQLGQSVVGWLADKVNSVKAKLSGLPDLLRKPIESLLDAALGKLNAGKSVVASVSGQAGQLVSKAAQKASQAGQTVSTAVNGFKGLAQGSVAAVKAGADMVKGKVGSATAAIGAASNSLTAKISGAKSVGQSAQQAVSSVVSQAKSVGQAASTSLNTATTTVSGNVKSALSGLEAKASGLVSNAQNVVTTGLAAANAASKLASSGWGSAKATAENILGQAKASVQAASGQVSQTATEISAKAGQMVQVGAQASAGISAGLGAAEQGISSAGQQLPASLQAGEAAAKATVTALGNQWQQKGEAISQRGQKLVEQADQIVKSKMREVEAMGKASGNAGLVQAKISEGNARLGALGEQLGSTVENARQEGTADQTQAHTSIKSSEEQVRASASGSLAAGQAAAGAFTAHGQAQVGEARSKGQGVQAEGSAQAQVAKDRVAQEKAEASAKRQQVEEAKAHAQQAAQQQVEAINHRRTEAEQEMHKSAAEVQNSQGVAQQHAEAGHNNLQQHATQANQAVAQQKQAVNEAHKQATQKVEQEKQAVAQEHTKAQETARTQQQQVEAAHTQAQAQATQEQAKVQQQGEQTGQTAAKAQEELTEEQGNISSQAEGMKGQINSAR